MSASVIDLIKTVSKNDNTDDRRQALFALGYHQDKKAYKVLLEQLKDPSPSIQHAAVISLGRFGNPKAIDELVKPRIFRSSVTNIRWAAVSAIGKLGGHQIIEFLLTAAEDSEWIVRNQAITILKDKIREIIKLSDIRHVHLLIRLLAIENEEIVDLAIAGLVGLGKVSEKPMQEALKSPSPKIGENAIKALGIMESRDSVEDIIPYLTDSNWRVRKSAITALGKIRDKQAIEPLVRCLNDNVAKVQECAIKSLIGFGRLSTEPILGAIVHEKSKYGLKAMLLTLGKIKDLKAAPTLIEHLCSSYFIVRNSAVQALQPFGPEINEALYATLSYNESDITPLLNDAANDDKPQLQIRAIKGLGGLEDHRSVGILKELVQKGFPEVQEASIDALTKIGCAAWGRCGALQLLGERGDDSMVEKIAYSLGDDSDNVRLEAVRALGKINSEACIAPLITVAGGDRDAYIRAAAVHHLRSIGPGHKEVLDLALAALSDPDRDVRVQAVRLLATFHDNRAIQPLLNALADEHWSVRESAEYAVLNLQKKAFPHLLKTLESTSWTQRFRAARLLGEIGDSRAIKPLEALLQKKGERKLVRTIAEQALVKIQKD